MHCVAEQGDTIPNSTYIPAKRVVELTSACAKWLKRREFFSKMKERKQSVIVTNARRGGDRKAESGRRPSQKKAEQKRRETLPAWMTPYMTTHTHAHHRHACIHTCTEWPYMDTDVPNVPKVKRSSEESVGTLSLWKRSLSLIQGMACPWMLPEGPRTLPCPALCPRTVYYGDHFG